MSICDVHKIVVNQVKLFNLSSFNKLLPNNSNTLEMSYDVSTCVTESVTQKAQITCFPLAKHMLVCSPWTRVLF